jgi:hypothetical protein
VRGTGTDRRAATLLLIAGLVAAPRVAWAWATTEHQEIGTASYLAACAEVASALDAAGNADGGVRARFDLACGKNRAVLARLYGDATAIAGDFVGHPSELLSPNGAWRFSSPKHYYLLALENSSHFNPMSTQSWREYHQDALDHALGAASAEGLPRVDGWEEAVRENAFADHLLQDSFASGHMGFNRRASSAAAAKSFHDFWNARGRVVCDVAGRSWTTYGDGKLDDPADAAGRRHVIDAATISVRDVLLTFVLGRRHPEEGLAAWRSLPFTIEAPELLVGAQELVTGRETTRDTAQTPLLATVLPARKNTVGHAMVWAAAPFSSDDEPTVAAVATVELAIPVLPAQASLGAGGTLHQPDDGHSLVVEGGLLAPLGLSIDGLWSHQVEAAASFVFLRTFTTIIHVEYQGNLELGTSLLSVHAGLAEFLPARELGWYAALGYGLTFSAAGGGSL